MANPNPKPPLPGPGRPKGSKNKIPLGLKEKVLDACVRLEAEGKDLATLAAKKPVWFWETFVKAMLPKDLTIRVIKSWGDLSDEEREVLLKEAAAVAAQKVAKGKGKD